MFGDSLCKTVHTFVYAAFEEAVYTWVTAIVKLCISLYMGE